MSNNNMLLPIGSVITYGDNPTPVAIVGYCPVVDGRWYDYYGLALPYGLSEKYPIIYFDASQIKTLLFEGYRDERSNIAIELIDELKNSGYENNN